MSDIDLMDKLPNHDGETLVRHLLKTAKRANEAGNFKREVMLLEQAVNIKEQVTGHLLRRYVAALYKVGEYRAASLIASNDMCFEGDGTGYTERVRESLNKRVPDFLSIISRLYT